MSLKKELMALFYFLLSALTACQNGGDSSLNSLFPQSSASSADANILNDIFSENKEIDSTISTDTVALSDRATAFTF